MTIFQFCTVAIYPLSSFLVIVDALISAPTNYGIEGNSPNNRGLLQKIHEKPTWEPHVYEISCSAYVDLAAKRQNQTILVSGVSGAGKTVTVKVRNRFIFIHLLLLLENSDNI